MHIWLEYSIQKDRQGRNSERLPKPCQGAFMPQQPLHSQPCYSYHRDDTGTNPELFLFCAGYITCYNWTAFIPLLRDFSQDRLRSLSRAKNLPSGSVHGFWQEIAIRVQHVQMSRLFFIWRRLDSEVEMESIIGNKWLSIRFKN